MAAEQDSCPSDLSNDHDIQSFLAWIQDNSCQGISFKNDSSYTICRFLPDRQIAEYFDWTRDTNCSRFEKVVAAATKHTVDLVPRVRSLMWSCRKIFTILVLIGQSQHCYAFFNNLSLWDRQLPFSEDKRRLFPKLPGGTTFFDDFYKTQWQFCAEPLSYSLKRVRLENNRILPIIQLKRVENSQSPRASVHKIIVHKEYDGLKESWSPAEDSHEYVLKSYHPSHLGQTDDHYDAEVEAFQSHNELRGPEPNLIGFYGAFTQFQCRHIIFQHANVGTLEDYWRSVPPPKLGEDIVTLWDHLFQLSRSLAHIHENKRFDFEGGPRIFQDCYGDIKPSNILVAGDIHSKPYEVVFMLADLRLSHFESVVEGNESTTRERGDSSPAYGAPELNEARSTSGHYMSKVDQNIDIWSLACVFSEFHAWTVDGTPGLDMYRKDRMKDKDVDEGIGACFHDKGGHLLRLLPSWHELAQRRRATEDSITPILWEKLLKHMFEPSPTHRPQAHQVIRHTEDVIYEARHELSCLMATNQSKLSQEKQNNPGSLALGRPQFPRKSSVSYQVPEFLGVFRPRRPGAPSFRNSGRTRLPPLPGYHDEPESQWCRQVGSGSWTDDSADASIQHKYGNPVKYLVEIFCSNKNIGPIYREIAQRFERSKFHRDHEQLLKLYCRELRNEAKNPAELETTRLLRPQCRTEITSSILRSLEPFETGDGQLAGDELPEDYASERDESSTESEDAFSADKCFPLRTIDEFLTGGKAFTQLQVNLNSLLRPPQTLQDALRSESKFVVKQCVARIPRGWPSEDKETVRVLRNKDLSVAETAEILLGNKAAPPTHVVTKDQELTQTETTIEQKRPLPPSSSSATYFFHPSSSNNADVVKTEATVNKDDPRITVADADMKVTEAPLRIENISTVTTDADTLQTEVTASKKDIPTIKTTDTDTLQTETVVPDEHPLIAMADIDTQQTEAIVANEHRGPQRVTWTCSCGVQLHDYYTEVVPGSLEKLRRRLNSENTQRSAATWYSSLMHYLATWIATTPSATQANPNNHGATSESPSGQAIQTTTQQNAIASGNSLVITSSGARPSISTGPAINPQPQQTESLVSYLLLCIPEGMCGWRLFHQPIFQTNQRSLPNSVMDDKQLFCLLREKYCKERGISRFNLKFWPKVVTRVSLAHFLVDFSELVDLYHYACESGGADCRCIPPPHMIRPAKNAQYHCLPREPEHKPPIGPNYLTHCFQSPECIKSNHDTFALDQIPKRLGPCMATSGRERVEAWGLEFEEGWNFGNYQTLSFGLVSLGSLVFAIIWSVLRKDVQSAFSISAVIIGILASVIAYMAAASPRYSPVPK